MSFLRRFGFALLLSLGPLPCAQTPTDISANLTFTTVDVPGAGYTGVWGINKTGDMVGNYGQDDNIDSHGFVYSNGVFTYFDYPGESVTLPTGINDFGVIVGRAGQNPVVGFLYDGTSFTNMRHRNDSATFTNGINNAAVVVGGTGTIYTTKGFQLRDGKFKLLNVPGQYIYVNGTGVNNVGTIVGWTDNDGFTCRGSTCKIIDFPGASTTEPLGINDGGVIVGWYRIPFGCLGCGFALKNGKYVSFKYPGADTYATGINASGQVVGQYTFDYQTFHGFVTSPILSADFR